MPTPPRRHNYDAVAGLVAVRVKASSGRISAKRLLPAARAAGYAGSARNFRRLVAARKQAWRQEHHRPRRPAVWSPGEHLVIDWGSEGGLHRWQNETLCDDREQLLPGPGTQAARRTGLAVLALGGAWTVVAQRAHPLAELVALPSACWAWRCWLRVNLERRRYAADNEEHAQRQAAIDKEFRRWNEKLAARPKDEDMAAWLGFDRTVLLGRALDHFQLPRSRLIAHAFLEEPGVAAKRARIEGGPLRYARYQLLVVLLAEDGVRQVKANLDFMTGTLGERERTSYRYDAIVSVRVLREPGRVQIFQLRLTAGDPITIRVRDADPGEMQQEQDARPTGKLPLPLTFRSSEGWCPVFLGLVTVWLRVDRGGVMGCAGP